MIVWLTGLPCSGKTTLGKIVAGKLKAELLDGDDLRGSVFSRDAGWSAAEREKHLRRVGFLAQKLDKYTDIVCAFVSPFESCRKCLPIDVLVYLKCPVEECAKRDTKGLYKKALMGELDNFTGVTAPYQPPINPALTLETDNLSIAECVDRILLACLVWKQASLWAVPYRKLTFAEGVL